MPKVHDELQQSTSKLQGSPGAPHDGAGVPHVPLTHWPEQQSPGLPHVVPSTEQAGGGGVPHVPLDWSHLPPQQSPSAEQPAPSAAHPHVPFTQRKEQQSNEAEHAKPSEMQAAPPPLPLEPPSLASPPHVPFTQRSTPQQSASRVQSPP